jgi:two-component system LytT family response regulator
MNDKIKTIIIDDETLARQITKKYLSSHSEIEIIAECSNGFDAIKKINEEKPDLIFLDIQMPKLTGFEMLELLENHPVIIFTTAYDNYAIKAFEVNAADYLLKPFPQDRFEEALKKAKINLQDKISYQHTIQNIIHHNEKKIEKLERVVIKDGTKITILPLDQIRWIEAQDDYVQIYTDNSKYLKKKTMKYFEKYLNANFIRVHRSYIISVDYIKQLEMQPNEAYKIILKNDVQLPVSKTGLNRLKTLL